MKNHKKKHEIHIRLSEFALPPIRDGLVLGQQSPIGAVAVGQALNLLSATSFTHIPVEDEVIADVIIRNAILRKVSIEDIRRLVLEEVKPLMGPEEILHLQIDIHIVLEHKGQ